MTVIEQLQAIAATVPLPFTGTWYVAQSITDQNIRVTLVAQVQLDGSTVIGFESHLDKTEHEWQAYLNTPGWVETALGTIPVTILSWFDEAAAAKSLTTKIWFIDGEEYPGRKYTFDTIEWLP